MLDIKFIRENPELVKKGIESKNENSRVDEVLQLDKQRREILVVSEELKAKRNQVSQDVGKLKKAGQDTSAIVAEMKEVSDKITEYDKKLNTVESELNELLMYIPNIPHSSVPIGRSTEDNVEVRRWLPEEFSFEQNEKVYDHIELGKKLRILDFKRGAKISGSGFPVYLGKGATLERALINFMLDYHLHNHGYSEVFPPFLVNRDSMKGTGQLPKMEEDLYFIDKDGLFPIPTAEVPITNLYRNEILNENDLPIKLVGYSACFRREAGSYGKESKGFLRVHQFNKVEMVKFVKPENSLNELENLVNDAEDILKALQIPYRILMLCSGDLSFAAAKCYDIETWSPAEKRWLEASSCSTFGDFQARRANIRYRNESTKKLEFVHTLNGSGLATSRLMVSLLENYQTPEGKIIVPKVLQKYTGFNIIE
ncbi:MAG: serine--tRNA ligase [Ignavibacteria bacterium RIFOXYB2_FULL_35_12]|nr:MAG: serine--tRNA ligase [Ignavibacteria bacterium GWA2_36_19]OGU63055.1 MAG: serine--tRNA ligase [Ignavibacteria bacterium GWF2_35_20]OGU87034.1 MAG: serine--tRNA ligase [Ignavibacteria bacterium RIFOXYC12_FULL_35_11]OGU88956.1 MAG: serine--tRNA ligase [Ignavibacteria bacterium RIFOXYA12_FULL_35_25]OGU94856.1 MAG: serine--tRNA ligase [Ignavibacteria bacterium RIFOXYB12_FULL_35_14]OGU98414.1 MAG: serine--tRNA ligase [Ignavibacteria bacterium RIFOXYC2_FULL_35_16]OGV04518.1 MAG: serine--tRNA